LTDYSAEKSAIIKDVDPMLKKGLRFLEVGE